MEIKMNKLPRLLAVTLALCMALLSISGMGVARAADPVKIKLWHIATEADPMHPAMKAAIDRYNAAHKDVQIEATEIANDDFKTQIQVAIAAGQAPDAFQTWGGGLLQNYVDAGVVREIKDLSGDAGKRFS